MSGLGLPPTPPEVAPPPGREPSDIPAWVLLVAAGVALSLAALLFYAVLHQESGVPKAEQPDPPASSYPAHWDHRIAPIAKVASRLRGLDFHHPVPVRFLPSARFEKSLVSDQVLTKGDRADIEHVAGLLRAFGLVSGDVKLVHAVQGFAGGATLAYYSFKDKRITVRGSKVTPSIRATLVHELTHVLQDQHFGVGDRLRRLQHQEGGKGPSGSASSVLDAIVEGDAERVEHLYAGSLTAQQQQALTAGQQAEAAQARKRLAQIPPVVVTLESSPYTLGEGLVQTVAARGGNAAVDRLFHTPPTHESVLLDPFRFVTGDNGATKVGVPKLQAGEKRFDSGEFGVLTLYFMLAERLPLEQALAAADGWGGDAYVGYERAGTACARVAVAGKTADDTARIYSALQGWATATPGSSASVQGAGDQVVFDSCDPGTAVQAGQDDSEAALTLVGTRSGLGAVLLRSGAPPATAQCLAGRLVQTYTTAQLSDPTFGKDDPTVQAEIQQLAAGCR
jgi:hypothetical protein